MQSTWNPKDDFYKIRVNFSQLMSLCDSDVNQVLITGVRVTENNIFQRFNVYLVINKFLTLLFNYVYIFHHYLHNPAIRELGIFCYINVI